MTFTLKSSELFVPPHKVPIHFDSIFMWEAEVPCQAAATKRFVAL